MVHFAEDTKPLIIDSTDNMASSHIDNRSSNTEPESAGSTRPASRSAANGSRAMEMHEMTAVDKKWGVLFSPGGQPTARFVEAMSSLSRYIVNAFLMTESIVLVPEKLSSFYNFHTVEEDPFQYQVIFQSQAKGSHRSLAEFYQDIGCAFHLVQASPSSPPRIPGLTPEGFARWMALQVQAFPDEVTARLARVISDFPLETTSAIDGKSERLPKQLSRYLLPKTPDYHIRSLLQQAVKRHFGVAALAPPAHAPASAPKPRRGISFSDGEDDAPRRKPDAIISEHRRYKSYSGPASPQSDREREDRVSDSQGRRGSRQDIRCDMNQSRPRQDRRSTEPSRRISADIGDDIRSAPQPPQQLQPPFRRHQHRHSHDSNTSYMSRCSSGRPSSPTGTRPQLSQHSRSNANVSSSTTPSGRDSRDSRDSRDRRDGRDSRRSRNPPLSLFSTFLQTGRSTSTRDARSPVRDGPAPLDKKSSSSLRRGASPQSRGYRASLPEIHNSGMECNDSGSGYNHRDSTSRDTREARVHVSESSSRRSSYIGSSGRGSIDTPPSSISDKDKDRSDRFEKSDRVDRVDRADGKRPKLRDVCYKAIERRDRDDKNYRMYGSTLPLSPLSTSPVLQYTTTASSRDRSDKSDKKEKQRSESANTKAQLVSSNVHKISSTSNSSTPGRLIAPRPPLSLQPTVVSDDRRDEDGNGSDSDQTWDEYLRSEDSQ